MTETPKTDMPDPLKVAIFGAGSIGCYLGGLLAAAGASVTFIGRKRFQNDLKTQGLTLTHYAREQVFVPAKAFDFYLRAKAVEQADCVLVCVKSDDTEDAGRSLARYVRKEAFIISFQNGVQNPDILRQVLPDNKVLGAVVPFNVTSPGPGHFHCGTEGDLIMGMTGHNAVQAILSGFTKSGQGCRMVDDIAAVQWGKLLVNLNNALNTLSGGTLKGGLMQRDYRRALALMIEEGIDVLTDAGITPAAFGKASPQKMLSILRLPNWIYRLIMNRILKMDDAARSSMLDDLEAGRQSEIKYLQGEITALAERTGQSAPINQVIMDAVNQAFEDGKSPKLSGAELLGLAKKGR